MSLTKACPDCDSARLNCRTRHSEHDYTCMDCGHHFSNPVGRERRGEGALREDTLAATVDELDPDVVTDGGTEQTGNHRCRNCGQRFDTPTEGGVPACPEGALHVAAEEDDLRADGGRPQRTDRRPPAERAAEAVDEVCERALLPDVWVGNVDGQRVRVTAFVGQDGPMVSVRAIDRCADCERAEVAAEVPIGPMRAAEAQEAARAVARRHDLERENTGDPA